MSATSTPFGGGRPLSIAALDAALEATLGRPPRRDRLERDDRVFRWICRRAIAEGSLRFNTTYAEAAAGAGYPVPRLECRGNRRRAREQRASTVWRALSSLQAAGLVRFHGVKRADGRWRCLSVGLTPAAYAIAPPFGRSRRAPRRGPHGRISFRRRSGTSPAVATAKSGPESVSVRARAREGPPQGAGGEAGGFLAAALAAHEQRRDPSEARPWPHERFDLLDQEVVELVELFEAEFGIPARFSYKRHRQELRHVLDRFNRFSEPYSSRAGFRHVARKIRNWARLARGGNAKAAKPQSLAYFLPRLREEARAQRRRWRLAHPDEVQQQRLRRGRYR